MSSTGSLAVSADLNVSATGHILLGNGVSVSIAGRSLEEASLEILRVVGPWAGRVGVEVLSPLTGSVSFRGAVRHSGSVALVAPRTLRDILSVAEPTDSADLSSIVIVSGIGRTYRVDSEAEADFSLRPGDQIVVPQSAVPNQILVLGAVKNPGAYPFKSSITLEQAVALAGGTTGHAILQEISVLRKDVAVPGADWSQLGRQSVLQRGDVVRVASVENGRYVSVLGHVKTAGLVPYRNGMTLMEAIEAAGGTIAGAGNDAVEIRKVFGKQRRTQKYNLNVLKSGSPNDPKLAAADVVFVPAFEFKGPKRDSGFKPVVPPRSQP